MKIPLFNNISELFRTHFMPKWKTPHYCEPGELYNLLYFKPTGKSIHPILIVPPLAGHHSTIAEPLVRSLMGQGYVICIDWNEVTPDRKHLGIEDIIQGILDAIDLEEPATLIGLCAGGWQAAIAASLRPDIETLIVAGAPINPHACDSTIQNLVNLYPQSHYEYVVELGNGVMKGEYLQFGWESMNAIDRWLLDPLSILTAQDDDLMQKREFRNWYKSVMDLPGQYYLQAVDRIFRKNELWNGDLELFGEKINLNNITSTIHAIAGENDDITPPDQCFAIAQSPELCHLVKDVGHIGVFMSDKSQPTWQQVMEL